MKKNLAVLILGLGMLLSLSCKKEGGSNNQTTHPPADHSLEKGLVSFSVSGEAVPSVIDTVTNTITVTLPDNTDMHNLKVSVALADQVTATINNNAVTGSPVIDLTAQTVLTVTSADSKRYTSFKIFPQSMLQYFGVGGNILDQNSLTRDYEFYYDQFDGSTFQAINCGPTVTTMALKWADSSYTRKPVDARNDVLSTGGWWFTGNVQSYLTQHGINNTVDTLSDIDALVKKSIDSGDALILCLDMFPVPLDNTPYEHVQKFYSTAAAGWGHFLFVKGYKQTSYHFYLEIYDPYSGGSRYTAIGGNELKGRNRYYISDDIKTATNVWWPYAIIVAPKGKSIRFSTHLKVDGIHKTIPEAGGQ